MAGEGARIAQTAENLATLDVRENNTGTLLASQDVAWNVFAEPNRTHDFMLLFTNNVVGNPLEFRVYWLHAPGAQAVPPPLAATIGVASAAARFVPLWVNDVARSRASCRR